MTSGSNREVTVQLLEEAATRLTLTLREINGEFDAQLVD
jgi:hypothetical protein